MPVCVCGAAAGAPDVPHIHTRRATQLQGWAEQEHGQPCPTAYEAGLAQAVRGLGELIAHLREGVDDDAWNDSNGHEQCHYNGVKKTKTWCQESLATSDHGEGLHFPLQ